MLVLLFLLFLVTPVVEVVLIVRVAGAVGGLNTVALLILVSAVGAWMVRHQGLGILARARGELERGRVPSRELVDGLLVLLAGALMLTPGFATDAVGLLLLMAPTRAVVRSVASRRIGRRMESGRPVVWHYGYRGSGQVLDARASDPSDPEHRDGPSGAPGRP